MKSEILENNLKKIFSLIENGNNLGEPISLVGATKMVDVDTINDAIGLGLKMVGENKVQEFIKKHEFIANAEQHFIGRLQTNKVKYLVGKVSLIHSVDSLKLAQEIDKVAKKKNLVQRVLVEINVGGELSKSGFSLNDAFESALNIAKSFENVSVVGLMAMLPHSDDNQLLIDLCEKMRALYDSLIKQGLNLCYLSMGMSNDYQIAIQHGSNMIRLGTSIFGKRNYIIDKDITNGSI